MNTMRSRGFALARRLLAAVCAFAALPAAAGPRADEAGPSALASVAVVRGASVQATSFDGVLEAVRQTVVAAQVSGAVVALSVKAGERVQAGQILLKLDARAAEQTAAAGAAQVQAARAAQQAATKEFERQKQLFEKNYIS